MRKAFTLCGIMVTMSFLVTQMQAQKIVPISFKPQLGVNFTDLHISNTYREITPSAMLGWNIGMDVDYGRRWQLKGGLHFFKVASGMETGRDTFKIDEKVSASQLKIPLGVSYKLWGVEYVSLSVHSQVVANITTKKSSDSESELTRSHYKNSSLSGRVGLELDLSRFTIEIDYERGVNSLVHPFVEADPKILILAVGIRI